MTFLARGGHWYVQVAAGRPKDAREPHWAKTGTQANGKRKSRGTFDLREWVKADSAKMEVFEEDTGFNAWLRFRTGTVRVPGECSTVALQNYRDFVRQFQIAFCLYHGYKVLSGDLLDAKGHRPAVLPAASAEQERRLMDAVATGATGTLADIAVIEAARSPA